LRYCFTGEEVEWVMKYWPKEWKVLVIPKKVPKTKQQVEVGPSKKSTIPTKNTRKAIEHKQYKGGGATIKNPRQENTTPKASTQENKHAEGTNGGVKNDTNIPMSEET
jgi:hypothetical protein